jgi:3-phosphoshikimate 1-carboxyvinyltransferase
LIFASLQKGESVIHGLLQAEDVLAHQEAWRRWGATFVPDGEGCRVVGLGLPLPAKDLGRVDMGNSGTAMRLFAGIVAASEGTRAELSGDDSLRQRPMKRITEPLKGHGADITSQEGKPPLFIQGRRLEPLRHVSPTASAQVKSCLMLAGIAGDQSVDYVEPAQSRDHTERMLRALSLSLRQLSWQSVEERKALPLSWPGPNHELFDSGVYYHIEPPYSWQASHFRVPGDISAAAFFLGLGSLLAHERPLHLRGVGLNPSRAGVIQALRDMGAGLEIREEGGEGEPMGDILVFAARLHGARFDRRIMANIIDEIPILAVVAAFAQGDTEFADAGELRVKESDRIHAICRNLEACGVDVSEKENGFVVHGRGHVRGGRVRSFQDHRIVMAFTVLGLASQEGVTIDEPHWVNTSFPDFFAQVEALT